MSLQKTPCRSSTLDLLPKLLLFLKLLVFLKLRAHAVLVARDRRLRRQVLMRVHAVLGARCRRLRHELEPLLRVKVGLLLVDAALGGSEALQ
jgi:hypothetical protein